MFSRLLRALLRLRGGPSPDGEKRRYVPGRWDEFLSVEIRWGVVALLVVILITPATAVMAALILT